MAETKYYLDKNGLETLVANIKSNFLNVNYDENNPPNDDYLDWLQDNGFIKLEGHLNDEGDTVYPVIITNDNLKTYLEDILKTIKVNGGNEESLIKTDNDSSVDITSLPGGGLSVSDLKTLTINNTEISLIKSEEENTISILSEGVLQTDLKLIKFGEDGTPINLYKTDADQEIITIPTGGNGGFQLSDFIKINNKTLIKSGSSNGANGVDINIPTITPGETILTKELLKLIKLSETSTVKLYINDNESNIIDLSNLNVLSSKPDGGWERSDLSQDVQESLDKADSALLSNDLSNYIQKSNVSTGLLKPDGSIDNTTYLTTANLSNYVTISDLKPIVIECEELPETLNGNYIYKLTLAKSELNLVSLDISDPNMLGIVIYFETESDGCVILISNAKWLGSEPQNIILGNRKYILTILDGIYHIDEYID